MAPDGVKVELLEHDQRRKRQEHRQYAADDSAQRQTGLPKALGGQVGIGLAESRHREGRFNAPARRDRMERRTALAADQASRESRTQSGDQALRSALHVPAAKATSDAGQCRKAR
jgi:hypothetical protein